jgi:uncharacterized membrane protein
MLNTNRAEAFSDGVFAIAATLLVLEMKVHTASREVYRWRCLRGDSPTLPTWLAS